MRYEVGAAFTIGAMLPVLETARRGLSHWAIDTTTMLEDYLAGAGALVRSVRGSDSCADFLIHDAKNDQRGYLDIWFCPGAKEHPALAEALIASIRPAPMPFEARDLPACE